MDIRKTKICSSRIPSRRHIEVVLVQGVESQGRGLGQIEKFDAMTAAFGCLAFEYTFLSSLDASSPASAITCRLKQS